MRTLNLGILAHVDAGKTSLTERLLFSAGVIKKIGSVDSGNTQTDSLALERQRGITIKAAVVSFVMDGVTVNLIDTPGHPDFIAEVERVIGVLDGAVLVVSAVEGVQAQTRVLMRALKRLGVPTVIFINKIDRLGAQDETLLDSTRSRLGACPIPMGLVRAAGTRAAEFQALSPDDAAFRMALVDQLTEHDDALLADYIADLARMTAERLDQALADQVQRCLVQPVFYGSAATGAGMAPLMAALPRLLPARQLNADAPVSGTVFKIERGWAGERVAYAALTAGTIRTRDHIALPRGEAVVTGIQLFDAGHVGAAPALIAGRIGKLSGLSDVRIGDAIGVSATTPTKHHFAPPTLETRILPTHASDLAALWLALTQLEEQDPLINLRKNDEQRQIFVSLYGEVQKEVIQHMLLSEFGIEAVFEESTVICVERLTQSGHALEVIFKAPNPYTATVGLRVDPRPEGSGVSFALEVDPGQMPSGFYRAVEEAVHETLKHGLFGWQVIDCHVAMTDVRHRAPMTTAADFRELTPLVLAEALRNAVPVVCEPIQRFHLDLPVAALGAMLPLLARAHAVTGTSIVVGNAIQLDGEIPAAQVHSIQQLLPGLTGGEGILECSFDHFAPVSGVPPTRHPTGPDPFNRETYLHRVQRKLAVTRTPEP